MMSTGRFLSTTGGVWSRGVGYLGCLGHGDWAERELLEEVAVGARSVSAGWAHSASIIDDKVHIWGRPLDPPSSALQLARAHAVSPLVSGAVNAASFFFDVARTLSLAPRLLDEVPAQSVVCGAGVTVVLGAAGDLLVAGSNDFGQCGVGKRSTVVESLSAVRVESPVKGVALGFRHGLAVGIDGRVWAWGKNENGQLGLGSRDPALAPERVPELAGVVSVACGLSHSAALTEAGEVFVWGKLRGTQVTNREPLLFGDALSPRGLPLQTSASYRGRAPRAPATAVACSAFHTVLVDADSTVWVLGLERRTRHMVSAPRPLAGLPSSTTLALRSGIDSVALFDPQSPTTPVFGPSLEPEGCVATELHPPIVGARFLDVSVGWKHALALVTTTKEESP
ncbi:hypothetical protein CTAYLR_010766 [Chrysophaeum taylorii]|uniref:Uncharacterized protein n=1 Tax=Chrysophaeum taylorii TaxID=2483200 RepID=A0AAD7UCR2_9STRA|nr:hypothetical protein CTAYLR_010766 [Chrysophaeum taylorii]